MKGKIICALAGLYAASPAFAQDAPQPLANFTSLCEEDAGTGFNWRNGEWVLADFVREKLTARKVTLAEASSNSDAINLCKSNQKPADAQHDEFAFFWGCYGLALGDDDQSFTWCSEFHERSESGWRVDRIACADSLAFPQFFFVPNGNFIFAFIEGDVSIGAKKGSLKVSHGSCSISR